MVKFQGKQFRGDLLGIGIDALSKCFRGNFAGFDFMQGAFPPSGHAHVGDHLLFYNIIYFQSFGSGNQWPSVSFHVVSGNEQFDDSGTCSRCTQAGILHCLFFLFIVQCSATTFHRSKQACLSEYGLRFGFLDQCINTEHGQYFVFLKFGQKTSFFFLTGFVIDASPPRNFDLASFYPEKNAVTVRLYGYRFFQAFAGESLQHASRDHGIDILLVKGKPLGIVLRND